MKLIIASVIMALGFAATGYFIGGRYTIIGSNSNEVTRLDRYTGEIAMCVPGTKSGCGFMLDASTKNLN